MPRTNFDIKHCVTILLMFYSLTVPANTSNPLSASKDSLIDLLSSASTYQRKIELLTHLSDINLLQNKYDYTLTLWDTAVEHNDQEAMYIAIRPLTLRYLDACQLDSANIWIQKCKKHLKGKRLEPTLEYLLMMRDIRDLTQRKELSQKMLEEKITIDSAEAPYQCMRKLYKLGALALMTQKNTQPPSLRKWDSYMEEGLEIAKTIPLEEDYIFRIQFLLALGSTDIKYTRELMELYKQYRKLPDMAKRVFSSHRTEIMAVARMLSHGEEIGHKQMEYYFKEFNRLISLYPMDVAPPLDFYYYYVALDYYSFMQDYPKAIACCDSVIKNAPKYNMDNLFHYEQKSIYHAKLKQWKEAYRTLLEYNSRKDSVDSQKISEDMSELQTRYDVNRLQLEKTNLIARQRGFSLLFLALVSIILAGWIIYIYRTLRITRNLKQKLEIQSEKALESEKMKTLFMNSMSHEIRTPLNVIQGFSGLILTETVEEELKTEIKKSIEESVSQLTDLLNDMLEISQLGCTNDILPTEPVEIGCLCQKCLLMEKQSSAKPNIQYIIENECGQNQYYTNESYIEKVLHNLLGNAVKFTMEGRIILNCRERTADQKLIISVTDTGIGIPEEKQEWVFNAFAKMDDFKPGTGLGLYVCREIIKHLRGTIYIDPAYKEGTKVVIELPV